MKHIKQISIISLLFMLTSLSYGELKISADIESYTSIELKEGNIPFNYQLLKINFSNPLDDNTTLFGSTGIRNIGLSPSNYNIVEMGSITTIYPFELYIDEAYLTKRNFIIENLDFTLGKQRIAWGKADKINPTDVLNPIELYSLNDFGKKYPTLALNLIYYLPNLNNYSIQLVLEPYSCPARLSSFFTKDIGKRMTAPIRESLQKSFGSVTIDDNWNSLIESAPYNITNGIIGAKFSGSIVGFDFSISGVSRLNDMPVADRLDMEGTLNIDMLTSSTNYVMGTKSYNMHYYRETILGFDIAKDLDFILAWLEASIVFPPDIKSKAITSNTVFVYTGGPVITNFQTVTNEETLLKDPYVKLVLGFDKNFDGGWYINMQYIHGFYMERGYEDERLQDYLMGAIEKSFFDDKFKIRLTGTLNINNLSEAFKANDFFNYTAEHYSIMGGLEFTYIPLPGIETTLGIMGIDGKENTTLGSFLDYDVVYLSLKGSF